MQTPVRYYITQSDDRAVVRSVPVTVPQPAPVDESLTKAAQPADAAESRHDNSGRTRVTRLVRAAARRVEPAR